LPIRRWTRQNHTVSQDAKIDIPDSTGDNVKANQPFPELPMPKDSHLLAPHSRALLRAARAGYIYLRPATKDTQSVDERDANEVDESTPATNMERSYTARKWAQIPRHVELPEVEFLAKRRTGLPSLYGASGAVTAAVPNASQPMRKAKIRKVNPDTGNITVYDAWIPEGQKIEGEIRDESQASARQDVTVTKATPAPGTVIEGVGVANAEGVVVASTAVESPTKRKGPPPPKRKGKGLRGKGRKKVMFAPGEGVEAGGEDQMAIDGEQDDDEEDDDGEEGEDVEEGEETVKTEEARAVEGTPQTVTPSNATAPTLDLDTTPNLPPATEGGNVSSTQSSQPPISPEKPASIEPQLSETPNIEPIKARSESPEKPRTPVQPQPEQLTPPDVPITSNEPTVANNQEIHDEMKLEPDVQDAEPITEVPSVQPNTDLMEDVQQTQASAVSIDSVAPAAEKIEVAESAQPAEEETAAVQTEVKVEQTTTDVDQPASTEAQSSSEPAVPLPVAVPETSPDLLGSLQSSLEQEPAQSAETAGEVKIEQEPNTTTTTAIAEIPAEPTAVPPVSAPEQTDGEIAAPATTSESAIVPEPVSVSAPTTADETSREEIPAENQPENPPEKEEDSSESGPQTSVDNAAESSDQGPPPSQILG
jgi:LYR motif-containing protein 4